MSTSLRQFRPSNHISGLFLFGCALALATAASPRQAEAQIKTTICKLTNPSPDPWGTSFQFGGVNGWPPVSGKDFTSLYPPNPFSLQDGQCRTFDITANDKFNVFAEFPVPPGWALTNIVCNNVNSPLRIIGANSNSAFQPGDNTVILDQTDPSVVCTFVNTLACFAAGNNSLPPCTRPGEVVTLPLSTRNTPGLDTNWTVAPGGPNPTNVLVPAWTAVPNNWVRPVINNAGTYTYRRSFHLPCHPKSYKMLQLAGRFAADNSGTVRLNGTIIPNACAGPSCFNTPAAGTVFAHVGPSLFVPGFNQLTVTVGNLGGPTGLSVVAALTARCGKGCVCGCPPGTVLRGSRCVR